MTLGILIPGSLTGGCDLRVSTQPEFRQALPFLFVQIELCAWLASYLQFHVKMNFVSTFSSFEFQPLSLSLVFNLKVTAEASFANASSLPLHFCYYDLLVGASLLRLRGGVTCLPEDVH